MLSLTAKKAYLLDTQLMGPEGGFTLEQLMELAGQAVSHSIFHYRKEPSTALVCCGSGNNGGDGLVIARYLAMVGHTVTVWLGKAVSPKKPHFFKLIRQLEAYGVSIYIGAEPPSIVTTTSPIILVDAIFGFSFQGPSIREPYMCMISFIHSISESHTDAFIVSVDVPSGWPVDESSPTPPTSPLFVPHLVVSLTVPKLAAVRAQSLGSAHTLGGNFLPPSLARRPEYALEGVLELWKEAAVSSEQRTFIEL
eukprot:gnl/Dysnectes_brevis/5259_a7483_724.p1 GENE.gnl/Dysnectes_brevis/5259_a7483_724~~gnl/Dysnectes_brevis/5259_a7483_724.p1  ORF type:complete len:252 (-),score=31.50 gnl/Dysnectes_brevis/5259_a7483_724:102-857(-)